MKVYLIIIVHFFALFVRPDWALPKRQKHKTPELRLRPQTDGVS